MARPFTTRPLFEKSKSVVNKNGLWPDYAPCTNAFFDSLGSTAIVSEQRHYPVLFSWWGENYLVILIVSTLPKATCESCLTY